MATPNKVFAFDHVPAGASVAGGNVPAYSDYGFTHVTTSGYAQGGVLADSGGSHWIETSNVVWTRDNATFYTDAGEWRLPVGNALDLSASRHWIGFRFKYSGALASLGTFSLASIGSSISVLLSNDLAFVAGQEYYAEVLIDLLAGTRTVLVDGQVVVSAQTIGSKTIASTDVFRLGRTQNVSGITNDRQILFKDFVFSSDSGAGTFDRLGPVVFKPITLTATQGDASWPALDGTSSTTDALNKTIATGEPTTVGVSMASDNTALVAALSTTADPAQKIRAVVLFASGERTTGTGTTLHTTFTDTATGASESLNPEQFPAGTMAYGQTLGVLTTAPDGSEWTVSKLEAMTLTLTAEAT